MRVAYPGKVTGENPANWGCVPGLTVEFFQNFLSGFDAVVLGLFEDGNAAEVGVGEEDSAIEAGQMAPLFGENRTDSGANHGVAHAHDIDAGNALADVGVDALEVVENSLLPVGPIFFEKKLPVLRRGAFGESPVKGPDGAVHCVRRLWCMAST